MKLRTIGTCLALFLVGLCASGCGGSGGGSSSDQGPAPADPVFDPYTVIPTGSWPEAIAIGDVNGDERPDVVLTTSFNDDLNDFKLLVFLQTQEGPLAPPATYPTRATNGNGPESVAVGDVNGDGANEVVVGVAGVGLEVFAQDGTGGLVSSAFYATDECQKIRIADLDDDGRMDVVGIGWGTDEMDILYQDGAGALRPPVTYAVTHSGYDDLDVGDLDHDGRTDVVVMSGQSWAPNIGVLYQRSGGGFTAPTYRGVGEQILTHGVAVGDVTGDGRQDVVVTYGGNRPYSAIGVFAQERAGTLRQSAAAQESSDAPEPVEVADVNGDGREDVVVVHGAVNALGVYLQRANGTLGPETLYPVPSATHYNPHGMALGDIDGDGRPDVVIADWSQGLVVLKNLR